MDFIFIGYTVTDAGIEMEFQIVVPRPGPTNFRILITDAELAAITTQNQLRTAVGTKLRRKLQGEGIASKLDGFIGQSITI